MSNRKEIPFRAVRGTDEAIHRYGGDEGYLYFATDTRKTYLEVEDGKKLLMGSDVEVFYGTKDIPKNTSGKPQSPEVFFYKAEIEGDRLPLVDDLILNKDGCFYRVDMILDAYNVRTQRLTLQGTGGGGGGSTPDGPSSGNLSIDLVNYNYVFSTEAETMKVGFIANYDGSASNQISKVSFILGENNINGEPFYTVNRSFAVNQTHYIDLVNYKDLFEGIDGVSITVKIQDRYGVTRAETATIKLLALSLRAREDSLIPVDSTSYNFICNLSGATSSADIIGKKLIYNFYREEDLEKSILTLEYHLNIADSGNLPKILDLSSLSHGIYVLKVQAIANINETDTIQSNVITHKIGYFVETASPLLLVLPPDKAEQYTNIPVEYLYVSSEINKTYTLEIRINNIFYKSISIISNVADSYVFNFEDMNPKNIQFTILETGITSSFDLVLSAYTGQLPVINLNRGDLQIYLNPKGKTNNDTDRDIWPDAKSGQYSAKLTGVSYSQLDGWLTDPSGASYLKLLSGARLDMPDFQPFTSDPVNGKKANGITIELDFEISGILDYTKPTISCVSYTNREEPAVGFELIGDKLKMYNSRLNGGIAADGTQKGVLSSQTIIEGKRVRLSYVIEPGVNTDIDFPMCYTYLDGKMSGATTFKDDDSFVDSIYPATLKIDSSYAQIKIYGIRFYNSHLEESVILNNYTASLATLEERQKSYDSNNIYTDKVIDFELVSSKHYDLQIPYMKLTGGYKSISKDDKWTLALPANMKAGLPTGKKDYRLVDVEVVYPKNEYFAGYEDYTFINEFEKDGQKVPMAQAGGLKPSNGGAIMYAQGTSSMEYPVKNLRLRFKKEKNWYKVRPSLDPVEIICMKADYMESSGSHNTGTANFVDDLYRSANMSTPGQIQFGGEGKPDIVTCIKGHPCLIFYSESPDGPYEYIGKYNLNLDKATPQPFGFKHADDFGWLPEGEEYWQVQYGEEDDGGNWKDVFIGQADPASGADYIPGQTETKATVQEGEKINSIHCFEFLDNAVKVCNFLNKKLEEPLKENETPPTDKSFYSEVPGLIEKDFKAGVHYIKDGNTYKPAEKFEDGATYYAVHFNYQESWYNTVWDSKEKRYAPGWTLGFESRYPEDRLGYHDADMLWPLASWLHELYCIRYGQEGYEADPDYAIARFKNEYECYLDRRFTLTYYLVTETLLMADSRVKNMMIATWNKAKKRYYPLKKNEYGKWIADTSADPIETNNYIFYPIFYDMDTMMGLDNTGAARFTYYSEDTDPAVYNGDEVLWNFVRDALPTELITWYTQLEQGLLNAKDILPYYNQNQANMANEAMYNGDAKYKYVDKFRTGYHDDLYDKDLKPGEAPYLYAAQGDRSLSRESFINNRVRFLMGKYTSDKFQKNDRIVYRQNCPTKPDSPPDLPENETDPLKLEQRSAYYVESTGSFNFTSLKTGYAGINLGANGGLSVKRFDGEGDEQTISVDTTSASGTEAYLLGLSTLSNLGDLSDKYMQKFIIESSDIRLKKLILGNPHRYYYNRHWNTVVGGQSPEVSLGGYDKQTGEPYGCIYLEEFNMQNCNTFNNVLNFEVCTAIEKIHLTGSGVSGIVLPENGLLSELRLPSTINKLSIVGHGNLTAENFAMGPYEYDTTLDIKEQKIGAGNGRYINDFSAITNLQVVDTPINTYEIVRGAPSLETYYLHGIDWTLNGVDPDTYCRRPSTWTYIDEETGNSITLAEKLQVGVQYYTSHFENNQIIFKPYEGSSYPSGNTYLYEKVSMLDENNNIVCIPTLEYLLTLNTKKDDPTHQESLSGKITIAAEGVKVNELAIYEKYVDAYPNLVLEYDENKVDIEEANRINFYPGATDKDYVENIGGIEGLVPGHFKLTARDAHTLTELIGNYKPVKVQTIANTFEFTGQWMDWADSKKTIYYQAVEGYPVPADKEEFSFDVFKPFADMDLVPIFKSNVRKYRITLYDYDGTELVWEDIDYQADIGSTMVSPYGSYNYREHSEPDLRWAFKGWQTEFDWQSNAAAPSYHYLKGIPMTSDVAYYAFYKEENVKETVSMISKVDDFFNFKETSYTYEGNTYQGLGISLKDEFRHLLKGKISLPKEIDYKGKQTAIIEISENGFSPKNSSNQIKPTLFTHIYFVGNNDNSYFKIGSYAFSHNNSALKMDSALEEVWLPASVREISDHVFYRNSKLKFVQLNDFIEIINNAAFENCTNLTSLGLDQLPMALRTCGVSAFNDSNGALKATYLPENLTTLNQHSFAGCYNFNPSRFGSEINPLISLKSGNTLNNAGNNTVTDLVIYCQNGAIAAGAFSGYKTADPLNSVTIISPSGYEDHTTWGLKIGEATTVAHQVLAQGG